MEYIFNHPWELGLLLAIVLAVALDLGRRVAVRYQIELAPQRKEQMGTIRDGLFILVSLLLGFTLTFAGSRFMERRSLLVEEAISIGTTYLRADTLPQPYRDRSKQLLREYVDARPIETSGCSRSSGRPWDSLSQTREGIAPASPVRQSVAGSPLQSLCRGQPGSRAHAPRLPLIVYTGYRPAIAPPRYFSSSTTCAL